MCLKYAVLKSTPKDLDALKTKAVLLIDLDRFEDAIELCDKNGLNAQLQYEKVDESQGSWLAMPNLGVVPSYDRLFTLIGSN